jgi:hypothetical protein
MATTVLPTTGGKDLKMYKSKRVELNRPLRVMRYVSLVGRPVYNAILFEDQI